jgi:hypothetical protein
MCTKLSTTKCKFFPKSKCFDSESKQWVGQQVGRQKADKIPNAAGVDPNPSMLRSRMSVSLTDERAGHPLISPLSLVFPFRLSAIADRIRLRRPAVLFGKKLASPESHDVDR